MARVTAELRHGRVGTARERVCLGHWRASLDAAPGRRGGGGGRDFGGRHTGATLRNFMKGSVAAYLPFMPCDL